MPVTLQRSESVCSIRMDGPIALPCAGEVKSLLMDWLDTGQDLELDLDDAESIDIPILQLLWAAAREGARKGVNVKTRLSPAAAAAMRDSGFADAADSPAGGAPR